MKLERLKRNLETLRKWWLWPILFTMAGALGLGNGAWSYITEPSLVWIRNVILTTLTLGIQAQKDKVYAEAARGPHEHAATTLVVFTLSLMLAFLFILVYTSLETLRRARSIATESGRPAKPLIAHIMGDIRDNPQHAYKRTRIVLPILTLYLTYSLGMTIARTTIGLYCTAAITYYNQLRTVVAPHADRQKLLEYDARFSTVQNRGDYLALMTELDQEARKYT